MSFAAIFRTALSLKGFDAWIVLNASLREMLVAFVCKLLLRPTPVIVFYDILLQQPRGIGARIKALINRGCLASVDVFLSVHRATQGYEREFGIPRRKFRYIPFKANNYEVLDQYNCRDGSYVLAAGASHRVTIPSLRLCEIKNGR
jgi:hypothetical protein